MQERRKTNRVRTYFAGRINFNQRCSTMDCLIRNLTEAGAMIATADLITVPGQIELAILPRGQSFPARIVWRGANAAGVAFGRA